MEPYLADPDFVLYVGDVRDMLRGLPSESVHCLVTSPPYYALRDYGMEGQLGLEESPELYIEKMVDVFREAKRVLRKDATAWINIGDSYASNWGMGAKGRNSSWTSGKSGELEGKGWGVETAIPPNSFRNNGAIKPKDLIGIPWSLAFGLRADGWFLRSDIIWAKSNTMPESIRDRPTKSHEYLFLLAKSQSYYYDAEAIKEPATYYGPYGTPHGDMNSRKGEMAGRAGVRPEVIPPRNKRSVWEVTTEPYPDAHFACVDDQTEALTRAGWRLHSELVDGDVIAAYNAQKGEIEWQKATIHRYPYSGEIVAIKKRDSSQRLTPNHRCLIRGGRVIRADELKPAHELPMIATFAPDHFSPPKGEIMALVGWYIAEGWQRKNTVCLSQSESANPQHVIEIRRLLIALSAEFTERRRERQWRGRPSIEIEWYVRGAVAERLIAFAPTKAMTSELANCHLDDARLMLDALIDGDGHRRADGRCVVIQNDKESIDLMQVLALRLGYRAMVRPRVVGWALYLTDGEWLTLRGTNGSHVAIPREHYEGVVWCPSVPASFWLARRDGKTFITGNTFPTKLIEPCILAGTSEKGCCPECGAPWEREVVASGGTIGHDWNTHDRGEDDLKVGHTKSRETTDGTYKRETVGWHPTCKHESSPVPCTVMDPFMGSGTTALVARSLGRKSIGIELNPSYAELTAKRLGQQSLFA